MIKSNTHQCDKADSFEKIIDTYWLSGHSKAPENLYHYTTHRSTKSIIESSKMWASAYECMNDDQEFIAGFDLAKIEIMNTIINLNLEQSIKNEFLENWKHFLNNEKNEPQLRPYVLSFSASNKNTHLWEKYSNDNQGLVIHLKNNSHLKDLINGFFVEVDYNSEIARLQLVNYLDQLKDNFNSNTCNSCARQNLSNFSTACLRAAFRVGLSYKEHRWSEEKEWRLVVFSNIDKNPHSSHGNIHTRTSGELLIDYLEVDLCKANLAIEGIEPGLKFPKNSKQAIELLAQQNPPLKIFTY